MPSPRRVFLSYSHDSEAHRDRVLALADRLRHDGLEAWIDRYDGHQDDWPRWMQEQIDRADKVLVVCTETYRRRFEGRETDGGLGVDWEGRLITGELYRRNTGKIVAVVFDKKDTDHLPKAVRDGTWYPVGSDEGYEALLRHLTDQPATPPPPVGPRKTLPPKRPRPPKRRGAPATTTPDSEPLDSEPLRTYRSWATERHRYLELIGLGADDVRIELDQVFVPVRISRRLDHLDTFGDLVAPGDPGGMIRRRRRVDEDLALDAIFRHRDADEPPHAILFGEPGSGKTTALRKLHRLARDPKALGLDADTLPVFFRLRCFTPDLLELTMGEVLDRELRDASGERLPAGLGEALWARGRLLLLFDGLDEIGDEAHRARVLRRLAWLLTGAAHGIRAVVSTRRSGWTKAVQKVAIDDFRSLDLRPFDDEQIENLVDLWFREVSRRGLLDDGLAETKRNTLLDVLNRRARGNQRLAVLVSTPLLLTLLCVVVTRGGEIPRRRVDFYEECLQILVGRWRQQAEREPPVTVESALALAGVLAWHLHSRKHRDDLTLAEGVATLFGRLGNRRLSLEVFHWLHRDAGLLRPIDDQRFGFAHLGFQEHLTARHLAKHSALLDEICGAFADSWWAEVFQLLAALPGGRGFGPLMERLLETDAPLRRADLLRTCLAESSDPDLQPFLRVLERGDTSTERRVALFLLLRGHHEPAIHALAERWISADEPSLRSAAKDYLDSLQPDPTTPTLDVVVLFGAADEKPAGDLIRSLEGLGLLAERVLASSAEIWLERLEASRSVALAVSDPAVAAWQPVLAGLAIFDESLARCVVRLPGEPRPAVPPPLKDLEAVDLRSFDDSTGLDRLKRLLRPAPIGPSPSEPEAPIKARESLHEPITDELFLLVPEGRYLRGSHSLPGIPEELAEWAQPEHWVRVSSFYLAKTPVTNQQYALFLEAQPDSKEPDYWRERRFSGLSQPVVGVSWNDAVAYCEWLSSVSEDELVFRLPTEAEWEFAARGEKSLEFPWGSDEPTPELACFGRDREKEGPELVGAYPQGAGSFGHLDLAGSVWEWCADAWEENHQRWIKDEPLDPVGEADPGLRPLRGGCWFDPAEGLRSAFRLRDGPVYRFGNLGFRVVCAPAS